MGEGMLWTPYLFIVYHFPKVLKLVALGVFGGVFLGLFLSVVSLIVAWLWPGVPYIYSPERWREWGLTE
jgi:uncharacterized membrane protein